MPDDGPHEHFATPALIRAAREAYKISIRKSLLEGGFEDIPKNGPFVLGGMVNFGAPLSEIVQGLGVSKQAASQLIDLLVLRGYLERTPDPADRRRVLVTPTERGRAAAAASRAGAQAVDRELARHHSSKELDTFRTCLFTLMGIAEGTLPRGEVEEQTPEVPSTDSKRVEHVRLLRFTPIFVVKDLGRALEHYRSLGFTVKAYAGGDDYGFAWRDGVELHLSRKDGMDPRRDGSEVYLYVEDADALAAEWSRPGIGGELRPVGTMDYGRREGTHVDLDGNVIRFGSDIVPPDDRSKEYK